MILKLIGFEADDVIKVAAEGQITEADFRTEDRNPLEAIVGASWATSSILLDMSAVTFIATTGIGWLLKCNGRCHAEGGALALFGLTPTVAGVFRALRLACVLTIAADEPAARRAIGAH
jgi:anti-anti-sigma factor